MHNTVFSGAIAGVDGLQVEVEIDISRGIPTFSIVGLPNAAVRESRERVTAAIKNSGWEFPLERITVNLAPADIKKEGSAYDLAIGIGILIASGQLSLPDGEDLFHETIFLGELALDGSLRKVPGVLPILLHARERGYQRAVVPERNFEESLIVSGLEVFGCRRLAEVAAVVAAPTGVGADGDGNEGEEDRVCAEACLHKASDETRSPADGGDRADETLDMADVRGQESAKRALLVAAAGGHHVLMVGPPGAGKTMLARRFPTLLPPLTDRQAMETTMIYSIVGLLDGGGLIRRSPFRSPHHSASDAGLIGGGAVPRPGEVTLAHNGILFLDELPEFQRHVLETLREPLEERRITISRAKTAVTFPARFQLVAAMNPCPCGYLGSSEYQCRCGPLQIERYLSKISGPLLDRISIYVGVRPVDVECLRGDAEGASSASMRAEVTRAREIQRRRLEEEASSSRVGPLAGTAWTVNAGIPEARFRVYCPMETEAEELLYAAQKRLRVSARGRSHIVRVARTIADLEGVEVIASHHVAEAVQYRVRDVPR